MNSRHDECCDVTRRTRLVSNDFVFDLSMLLDRVRRIFRSVVDRRACRVQVHFDVCSKSLRELSISLDESQVEMKVIRRRRRLRRCTNRWFYVRLLVNVMIVESMNSSCGPFDLKTRFCLRSDMRH